MRRCVSLASVFALALAFSSLLGCGGSASVAPGTPGALGQTARVVGLAAGVEHTCALLSTGRVACWGGNFKGQLGDGGKDDRGTPRALRDLDDAVEIVAGTWHTCARRRSGKVACWGDGSYGQLGDGTTVERRLPGDVSLLDDAVQLTAGGDHSCALRKDGRVMCWGRNGHGEIARGRVSGASVPAPIDAGLVGVAEVRAGGRFTCARMVSGELTCFSSPGDEPSPPCPPLSGDVPPVGNGPVSALAGGDLHACAIAAGEVSCWGDDRSEQLGTAGQDQDAVCTITSRVMGEATAITAGSAHTCALAASGQVACWGSNQRGQLGGGTKHRTVGTPTPVASLGDATMVVASHDHTCALRRNGEVWCWGSDQRGELGDGGKTPLVGAPVRVQGLD